MNLGRWTHGRREVVVELKVEAWVRILDAFSPLNQLVDQILKGFHLPTQLHDLSPNPSVMMISSRLW